MLLGGASPQRDADISGSDEDEDQQQEAVRTQPGHISKRPRHSMDAENASEEADGEEGDKEEEMVAKRPKQHPQQQRAQAQQGLPQQVSKQPQPHQQRQQKQGDGAKGGPPGKVPQSAVGGKGASEADGGEGQGKGHKHQKQKPMSRLQRLAAEQEQQSEQKRLAKEEVCVCLCACVCLCVCVCMCGMCPCACPHLSPPSLPACMHVWPISLCVCACAHAMHAHTQTHTFKCTPPTPPQKKHSHAQCAHTPQSHIHTRTHTAGHEGAVGAAGSDPGSQGVWLRMCAVCTFGCMCSAWSLASSMRSAVCWCGSPILKGLA